MIADPADMPFRTREEAEHVFAGFRQAAERGTSGPPGERLVFTRSQHLAGALADTLDVLIAPDDVLSEPLGEYELAVIGKVAGALDPVDAGVLCSMIRRAAHDQPRP